MTQDINELTLSFFVSINLILCEGQEETIERGFLDRYKQIIGLIIII
jgi:hypothetical protein